MEKYVENYQVRTYECGETREVRLQTVFNLLQSMATNHAEKIGVGYDALAAKGGFWVYTAYDIQINRFPREAEKIILKTWPSDTTLLTAIREIQITDEAGTPLVNASCQFAIVDFARHRPARVQDFMPSTYEALNERLIDTKFPHLAKLENPEISKKMNVRYDDIDVNRHVNNSVYPVWAEDALSPEFRAAHTLKEIRIEFKKSAVLEDSIVSEVVFDGDKSLHAIKSADDGREFARVEMTWQKKDVV